MLKRHKDLLRPLVASLRATLAGATGADGTWQRGDLDRELERLGIAPDGTATPIDALPNATAIERRARVAADAYLTAAVNGLKGVEAQQKRRAAREEFVERAAYTWINRLLALRTMEARGLIDETLRANPDYEGISEALFVLRQTDPARCTGADGGWWAVIEDACTAQAAFLPGLFDLSDPSSALRPSTAALLRCVTLIGGAQAGFTLEEADTAFADPDAIGWAYQFYQEAAKARVYEKLGSGGKATTRAEIAAATQLFTEPYMVQWLLQNSLGRSYHEAYPDSKLPESWAYYIRQRPEGQTAPESPRPLEALDLIDPCCGSGHFLREAFDMFVAMYRERHPNLSAVEVADRILERHLHGIDLDPRAAQLAALTLYLRAWELVRKDEGGRMRDEGGLIRATSSITYHPPVINIATTPSFPTPHPSSLIPHPFLTRHLRRHPQDRLLKPLLEGVFAALEQADILGSLLRPAEHIEAAMKALQQPHTVPMDFDADDTALRRTITTMARHDPAELKRMLLDRVAQSFAAESGNADDVAAQLFGREAERGVRLLQLLDRKYAVVVTNPPYMGSKNMDAPLKKYLEQHYKTGKRDLYTAFILRCLKLCRKGGRLAMVTMQSWMFLGSFADLRAVAEDELIETPRKHDFTGLLRETTIEGLSQLGPGAFEEIGGEVVQSTMFTIGNQTPQHNHRITSFRLIGFRGASEKASMLIQQATNLISRPQQSDFLKILGSPLVYWLRPRFFELLAGPTVGDIADIPCGPSLGDTTRFTRYIWESMTPYSHEKSKRWVRFDRGGGYRKWSGFYYCFVEWERNGARIKNAALPGTFIRNENYFFRRGWVYSSLAQGSLGVRLAGTGIWGSVMASPIFFRGNSTIPLGSICNSRLATAVIRWVRPQIVISESYVGRIPIPDSINGSLIELERHCVALKNWLVALESTEYDFENKIVSFENFDAASAVLHTLESINEYLLFASYGVADLDRQEILDETGTPAGFHPLIAGYDALPELPADLDVPPLPKEVIDYLAAHERISPSPTELARIKDRLRALYEAGPGADPHPPPPLSHCDRRGGAGIVDFDEER